MIPESFCDVAGDPRIAHVRAMLQDQHDRLIDAIEIADKYTAPMVKHYLAKVRWAMSEPPMALACSVAGMFGENGYAPAIRDVCKTAHMSKAYGDMIAAGGKFDGSFEAAKARYDEARAA